MAVCLGRHGGMAGGGRDVQLRRQVTLLSHADQRHRGFHTRHGALDDRAAFIQHGFNAHAALVQAPDDFRLAGAADFLIVSEGQVDGALGYIALLDLHLDCLQDGHGLGFDIQRAATPDETVYNLAGKGWMLPLFQGGGVGRDDIQVRHEDQGGQFRVFTYPGVEQAVFVDGFTPQVGVHAGEHFLNQAVQAAEFAGIRGGFIAHRDGLTTNDVPQPLGSGGGVHLQAG